MKRKERPTSTGRTTIDRCGEPPSSGEGLFRFKPEGVEGDNEAPRLRRAPSSSCVYCMHINSREESRSPSNANLDRNWVLSVAADWAKTWSAISRIDVTRGSN